MVAIVVFKAIDQKWRSRSPGLPTMYG